MLLSVDTLQFEKLEGFKRASHSLKEGRPEVFKEKIQKDSC